jgi:two-component system NtrC family sensor kinase
VAAVLPVIAMSPRLGSVFHSLGVRLLVPLSVTIGIVLTLHAVIGFDATRSHLMHLVRDEVQRTSDLIQHATHDGMLLNRLEEVQTTIERLAGAPDLAAIRIYDKDGEIVMSSDRSELGRRIGLEAEPCLACHAFGAPLSTARLEEVQIPDPGSRHAVLRRLTVIPNEPSCAADGCHAPPEEEPVLGALDVELSTAPIDSTLSSARRQLVWTTLVLVLVVVLVTGVFFRRLVQRPIATLHAATEQIAAGELSTRIAVEGQHELAHLGKAFNRMAADLGAAREELRDWSRKLETKVVEKTEELRRTQRQMMHSEKMASLGKLSATVAHEINNPLSGVLAYARLVEREVDDLPLDAALRAELKRYLGLIQRETGRCGEIVKDLLLFARRRGAEMTRVDVDELVQRALMLVRHHLEMRAVRLRFEPLGTDREIVADAGQLQQGLVALFVNAAEAMSGPGQDGGELEVRITGDADEVRIDVGDTGTGIAPEVLPHIFEPFFSTKDEKSGVGLGLAVVYGIVQRHGGSIDVESTLGRGTTFHIRMPRQPRAAPEST